jgi:hypothetical protein
MSLKNVKLLSPCIISLESVVRWTISPTAWENEDSELQRGDGRFECRDGEMFLIYGTQASLLACCRLQFFFFFSNFIM